MLDKHQPDMISSNDDVEDMFQEGPDDNHQQVEQGGVAIPPDPHEEARPAKANNVMAKPSQ